MIIQHLSQAGPALRVKARTHRIFKSIVLVGLLALGLPITAGASPTVSIKLRSVPIAINPAVANGPTYPGTGDALGAGAAIEGEARISGEEYGGFPSPVTGVTILAPAGMKLHPQGFATCSEATLESHEVTHCPKKSYASSIGSVDGVVSFGGTRVHEALTLQGFFAPNGELAFYAEGISPTSIEVIGKASVTAGEDGFGPKFSANVPLVETVPEAPYGVVEAAKITVGAGFMQAGKLISYITLPKQCPRPGFPVRCILKFLIGEPVVVDTKLPCPAR